MPRVGDGSGIPVSTPKVDGKKLLDSGPNKSEPGSSKPGKDGLHPVGKTMGKK